MIYKIGQQVIILRKSENKFFHAIIINIGNKTINVKYIEDMPISFKEISKCKIFPPAISKYTQFIQLETYPDRIFKYDYENDHNLNNMKNIIKSKKNNTLDYYKNELIKFFQKNTNNPQVMVYIPSEKAHYHAIIKEIKNDEVIVEYWIDYKILSSDFRNMTSIFPPAICRDADTEQLATSFDKINYYN